MAAEKEPTVPVKYIGRHATLEDKIYDTGHWVSGETVKLIPHLTAQRMFRHVDAYVPASTEEAVDTAATAVEQKAKVSEKELDEQAMQDARESIANMPKDKIIEYAGVHYGQKLDSRKSLPTLRSEVTSMIDRFGAL